MLQDVLGHTHSVAVLDTETKLAVVLAGGDELVGISMDAGLDAEQNALLHALLGADGFDAVDLFESVDDDGANAALNSHFQFSNGLVVAVEMQVLGIEAGLQSGVQLAAGNHVGVDAFRSQDRIQEAGAQSLAGVSNLVVLAEVALHGGGELTAVLTQLALAHNVSGSAVLLGDVDQIDTVHVQMTIVSDGKMLAVVGFHINSPLMRFEYLLLIDHNWYPFLPRRESVHLPRSASRFLGFWPDWAQSRSF